MPGAGELRSMHGSRGLQHSLWSVKNIQFDEYINAVFMRVYWVYPGRGMAPKLVVPRTTCPCWGAWGAAGVVGAESGRRRHGGAGGGSDSVLSTAIRALYSEGW